MVTDNTAQRILQELSELKTSLAMLRNKTEEIQEQSRENGNEIKLLRTELGLNGEHGRLPVMETTILRMEKRQEESDKRIDDLEALRSENQGRQRLIGSVVALAGGGIGAIIGLLWHH
jgi:chromosome segregation ATPase